MEVVCSAVFRACLLNQILRFMQNLKKTLLLKRQWGFMPYLLRFRNAEKYPIEIFSWIHLQRVKRQ